MKRFLLAPIILFLASTVQAGIPEKFKGNEGSDKWVQINRNWTLNTEEVELKRDKLVFYADRIATKNEFEGPSRYVMSYVGKITVKCSNFTAKIQGQLKDPLVGNYWSWGESFEGIKPNEIAYDLASRFCFLTGIDGYTRDSDEPEWATKVIKIVQSKPIKKATGAFNVDCDSPVWRNKPECLDY